MSRTKTTLRFVLREDKARADGRAPIWLRITAHRRSRYVATGIFIDPRYWNPVRQEVRRSYPNYRALNERLREIYLEAEAQAGEGPEAVKRELQGNGQKRFLSYAEAFIERLREEGNFWAWKRTRVILEKFRAYFGEGVTWGEITPDALKRFELYLLQKRGNNPNTVQRQFRELKRIFRHAVKAGIIPMAENPFLQYEGTKPVKPVRRKLSLEEMQALEVLELRPNSWEERARDAFLLSFYGAGIRFGDLCQLRPENISRQGILSYRMMKTGRNVEIPLPPQALAIVEKWEARGGPFLFPFLREGDDRDPFHLRRRIASANTQVNMRLKRLAEQAGIEHPEEVSFHVARHSFADYARSAGGDLYAISKALGHSKLEITERYLKEFDREAVTNLQERLWKNG